jgi:hypothetical protein
MRRVHGANRCYRPGVPRNGARLISGKESVVSALALCDQSSILTSLLSRKIITSLRNHNPENPLGFTDGHFRLDECILQTPT